MSGIDLSVSIERFDSVLFAVDTSLLTEEVRAFTGRHPEFGNMYFQRVLGISVADSAGLAPLKAMLADRYVLQVHRDADSVYTDIGSLEQGLTQAFKRFKYYFPGAGVPDVYTYPASISGFAPLVWNADSTLAIGLDCFLGADYHFYETTDYPAYITRRFTPQHLVPMALKGFAEYHFPPVEDEGVTFLSRIVQEGKVLYLLDLLLPGTPDSVKIGYSAQSMGWAREYEEDIWAYFIEEELLYSVDLFHYRKYVDEAPFTSDLGEQSAPRIGQFAGWQIVRRYMEENPAVTPAGLMAEKDAQKILRMSGYKPK